MNISQSTVKIKRGFLAYLTTDAGRKIAYAAAAASSLGLFMINWAPETFALQKYKDFVQCYENGMPKRVPEKVLDRLDKAMDTLKLHGYERDLVQPFSVFGFDMFAAGSLKYRFGGILGIPVNFSYESPMDIKKNDIRFQAKPIDWNSDAGKILQEALVLTEDEQIFGLTKAILDVNNFKVMMNAIFPSISFIMVYALGRFLNMKMNLFARHISVRLVMYTILSLFGIGNWCFMKDFNQVQMDTEIDKTLAALGPEYVDAGLRFYEKLLKKNIALRELLGDSTYTAKGNLNYLIRQRSLPLTLRKYYFEQKLLEKDDVVLNTEDAVTV